MRTATTKTVERRHSHRSSGTATATAVTISESAATAIQHIRIDLLDPSTTQPRQTFDDNALRDLAASIKRHVVIQPIIARPRGERFEIVAGERRVWASTLAGLTTIPAQVRVLNDAEARRVQLVENLQRENVHPIEEADAFQALLDSDPACTPEVIAAAVGKSRRYVYQCLTYRRLIPEVREAFHRNILTAAHAARIAQIPEALQSPALGECFFPVLTRGEDDGLDAHALAPVRQLDKWIQKWVKLDPHSEDTRVLLPELADEVTEAEDNKSTVLALHPRIDPFGGDSIPTPVDIHRERRCVVQETRSERVPPERLQRLRWARQAVRETTCSSRRQP